MAKYSLVGANVAETPRKITADHMTHHITLSAAVHLQTFHHWLVDHK